jgi:hypothetical protein
VRGADVTHSGGRPHSVGDRGQRYEVRATGYPKAEMTVIGWCTDTDGAEKMASAIRQAPGCTSVEIYDRQEDKSVITRYAGILR